MLWVGLDSLAYRRGISLIHHVAGIANAGGLKNDNFRFLVRGRPMLNAALDVALIYGIRAIGLPPLGVIGATAS